VIAPKVGGDLTDARTIDEIDDPRHWEAVRLTTDVGGGAVDVVEISECRIVGSRMSRLDIDGIRIRDTVFEDCDLSGTSMQEASLTRVSFVNCRLSGLVLNAAKLRDVRMTDCKADQLSLRMANVERWTAERVQMPALDCTHGSLTVTRLFDCDLTDAEFSNATFDDVRLHGSRLDAIRGIEHMRGVVIDLAQMPDFAAALLAANRITVDDERAPEPD
jgi:hypothetical protein